MFGVLVVQDTSGKLGYLSAFSGKLEGKNDHPGFVPPVFDMLAENSFFLRGEQELNQLNRSLEALENDPGFLALKRKLADSRTQAKNELELARREIKAGKKERDRQRKEALDTFSSEAYGKLLEQLRQESLKANYDNKVLSRHWQEKLSEIEQELAVFEVQVQEIKETRKFKSADLQQQLFDSYHFLNREGESKSLCDLFKHMAEGKPPSGAGECAAPKLLQYAFSNGLKPLALAEFWWGDSPKSEIRKHGQFYPACRGKCEPILAHMLAGTPCDPNPMLINPAENKELEIIFEDESLAVVNKPSGFLSVPGKSIADSVYSRMLARYPEADGPLIVHRLDMCTSGLLLIAKNKEVHKALQQQFIKHSIQKRYVALLGGTIEGEEGQIDLPLRVDLDDRPRQLVCYEYGKPARTGWKVIERKDGQTRVYFFPFTGRTHQLRVHAAHPSGLNAPILGDDLYGNKDGRLCLHAEWIRFRHPVSKEWMELEAAPAF